MSGASPTVVDGVTHDVSPVRKGRIELDDITVHNQRLIRLLNMVVFPVRYGNAFYRSLVEGNKDFTKLAFYDSVFVGCVACRPEVNKETGKRELYIMTIGVLKPYRRLGIGRLLLEFVFKQMKEHPRLQDVESIYLHMHTVNKDGLAFYKSFGFETEREIPDYYRNIEPHSCYVLRKTFDREAKAE